MNIIQRQNTFEAIKYHKASQYCFRRENKLRYIIIIVSLSLCVLGIFLNYLKDFSAIILHGLRLDSITLTVVSYASGFFLIIQMFLNIIAWRMHIEGVNIKEKYDLSVYGVAPNEVMMRPIQEALIDHYAAKIKRPDMDFYNQYWANNQEVQDEHRLVFENQKKLFYRDYQLMIFVKQRYFNFLWVGFFIIILAFSIINATDTFESVLNGIFFPSLSAISMIVASWKNYNETFIYLQNVLNCLSRYENEKTNPLTLRNIQDAMFTHKANGFVIPFFMSAHYERWKAKNERTRLNITNKKIMSIEKKQLKSDKAKQKELHQEQLNSASASSVLKPVRNSFSNRGKDEIQTKPSDASKIQPPKLVKGMTVSDTSALPAIKENKSAIMVSEDKKPTLLQPRPTFAERIRALRQKNSSVQEAEASAKKSEQTLKKDQKPDSKVQTVKEKTQKKETAEETSKTDKSQKAEETAKIGKSEKTVQDKPVQDKDKTAQDKDKPLDKATKKSQRALKPDKKEKSEKNATASEKIVGEEKTATDKAVPIKKSFKTDKSGLKTEAK